MDRSATDHAWCLSEVEIFVDLSDPEMATIGSALPMKTYAPGQMLATPDQPIEVLFILKRGRVRLFRVSADGRALTTAILNPGTIFGQMRMLGQHLYDNYAEALDETAVCVMSRPDVEQYLLVDPRIVARITESLGRRLAEMEHRLAASVFDSVPQRVAATLLALARDQPGPSWRPNRNPQIALTHEQIAALVGTSRETTTKVLGDLATVPRQGVGRVLVA